MSEQQIKQAVVDNTKAPPKAGAEVADARDDGDDLDTLLSQFDGGKKDAPATPPEQKTGTDSDVKALTEQVKGLVSDQQQRQFKTDMDVTIKKVRGDQPADYFDDTFMKAFIDAKASEDPRLAQAWVNRHNNPKAFEKVVSALGRSFADKYGKLPDKGATEDREIVTASVRGASTKAPEGKAPDFTGMSNAEFREAHKKEYGYYPPV